MRDMTALGSPMGALPHAASWNNGLDSLNTLDSSMDDSSDAEFLSAVGQAVDERFPSSGHSSTPDVPATLTQEQAMAACEVAYAVKPRADEDVMDEQS